MVYTVGHHQGGFVVARSRGNGEWVAVSDHLMYESARREAVRLNAEHQARQRMEARRAMLAATAPRRPVRYFEADAFA
jgi:alpha-D-ribose 1-methylphosphonate 5-triphosphate synthase subunit PhnG